MVTKKFSPAQEPRIHLMICADPNRVTGIFKRYTKSAKSSKNLRDAEISTDNHWYYTSSLFQSHPSVNLWYILCFPFPSQQHESPMGYSNIQYTNVY